MKKKPRIKRFRDVDSQEDMVTTSVLITKRQKEFIKAHGFSLSYFVRRCLTEEMMSDV